MERNIYAEVSTRIITELEAGAAPWIKPWSATPGAKPDRRDAVRYRSPVRAVTMMR